jgi:two-component system response regulator FixJ
MRVTDTRLVYVIDDDLGVLESTAFLLPALGYECVTFGSAEEFLGRAPGLPRGCVVTDLRMPTMDGLELAAKIVELGLGWPILMMTSDDGPDLERRAADQGITAVLRKPIDAALLADALSQAFTRFQS